MKAITVEKQAKTLHVPRSREKGLKMNFIKFCLLLVEGHNGLSDVCRSYPFHGPPLGLPTLKQSGKYDIQRAEGEDARSEERLERPVVRLFAAPH